MRQACTSIDSIMPCPCPCCHHHMPQRASTRCLNVTDSPHVLPRTCARRVQGAYFIGKAVWGKGYRELLTLLADHAARCDGSGPHVDIIGAGGGKLAGRLTVWAELFDQCCVIGPLALHSIVVSCALACMTKDSDQVAGLCIIMRLPCR